MSESRGKFEARFRKIVREDITVGDTVGGSADGFDPDGNIVSSDFYAPGDARKPKALYAGVLTRKGLSKKRKKRRKRRGRKAKKS